MPPIVLHGLNNSDGFTFDSDKSYFTPAPNPAIRLRQVVDATDPTFDRDGIFIEDIITTPVTKALGFTSLHSAELQATIPDDSSIDFQLSSDGGSEFLYWDGGSWSTAGATDFSDITTIQTNISTFPLRQKLFSAKIRITPSTDSKSTPTLSSFILYGERVHNIGEDALRSLKQYLDANLGIPISFKLLSNGTTTQPLSTNFNVSSITSVFNDSTDPNHTTNLFSSYSAPNIILTSAPAGGSILSVESTSGLDVFIGADVDYNKTGLPVIYIELQSVEEFSELRYGGKIQEKNLPNVYSRLRAHPLYKRPIIRIHCAAAREREAQVIAQDVARVLEFNTAIPSIASGQAFQLLVFTPMETLDRIDQNMHDKSIVLELIIRDFVDTRFEDLRTADKLVVNVGDFKRKIDSFEVT